VYLNSKSGKIPYPENNSEISIKHFPKSALEWCYYSIILFMLWSWQINVIQSDYLNDGNAPYYFEGTQGILVYYALLCLYRELIIIHSIVIYITLK
jgi:hypothetical protein